MKLGKSMAAQQKLRLERQTLYMRALQEHIPDASSQFRGALRGSAAPSPRLADLTELVELPPGWLGGATDALTQSLDGIVPRSCVRDSDWFLSSLLHPSLLRAQKQPQGKEAVRHLRQRYTMPPELILCGTTSLRLAREAARALNASTAGTRERPPKELAKPSSSSPIQQERVSDPASLVHVLSDTDLATFAIVQGRDKWILFAGAAPQDSHHEGNVPLDVLLSAETCLCGAISLMCGPEAVLRYLDRSLEQLQKQSE